MPMSNASRLCELGMVPQLAKEITTQMPAKPISIAAIGTVDATDLPSAIALANATKARVNQLIAALKA